MLLPLLLGAESKSKEQNPSHYCCRWSPCGSRIAMLSNWHQTQCVTTHVDGLHAAVTLSTRQHQCSRKNKSCNQH